MRQGVGDNGRERKGMRIFSSLFKCLSKQTEVQRLGMYFKNPLMIPYDILIQSFCGFLSK